MFGWAVADIGSQSMRKIINSVLQSTRIVACILGVLAVSPIWAQVETGQITGTITEATGGVVPNASLKIINSETGGSRETASNSAGIYAFPNLESGTYDLTVSAKGFSTIKEHVTLNVGQRLGKDFKLEVGAANTIVEVTEAAVQVNTETQSVSNLIDSKLIDSLPSLTRNPYDFVATVPNVSDTDPSGRGVGFSINGQRAAGTNVMLDGVANNDEFTASVGQQVPLDSVQEYSITTSGFTAEVGRASAGVVNLVTKSGTNVFHGSAYEFNRVSALGSNSFFNNANGITKGIYDRNLFGFAVGGPVIKNKLFFFQNTEWNKVRSSAPQIALVPTSQFIAAAAPATQSFFSTYGKLRPDLTILKTFTKAQLNPCTKGAAASDPCTALPSSTPLFNEVTYNTAADAGGGLPQNTYDIVGNVDYNLNAKTQFSAKYALYSENDFAGSVNTSPYAGYETGQTNFDNHITLSLTHTFTPSLISQTRLSYNRLNNQQPLGSAPIGPTLYMSASGGVSLAGEPVAFPGYSEYTPGNAIPFGGPQNFAVLTQDVTKVLGKHSIRFGGLFTYIQDNRTFGAYEEAIEGLGTAVGADISNFLSGQIHEFEAAVNPQGKFPGQTVTLPVGAPNFSRSNRYKEGALYVQDSWKVSRRVTVNAGLRWEYYGVQHNGNSSLDSNFYAGPGGYTSPAGIAAGVVDTVPNSPNKTLWNPQYANFAPRLGIAWDVFGDGKTSLRAGYGIGYERNFGNVTFNIIQNPPNYAVLGIVAGTAGFATIPLTNSNAGPLAGNSGSIVLPPVTLRAVDPNIKTAYAHNYNFSLEHQFGSNVLVSETYTGSAGENLYSINYDNLVGMGNAYGGVPCSPGTFGDPGTCTARLNTQYGSINGRTNGGISNYNALISRVITKNFWKTGITLDANYTWSHAIDNLSDTFSSSGNAYVLGFQNPFNPMGDRADANFDIRHRVAISGIWQVPYPKGNNLQNKILGGWEFSPIFTARSGSPYSIYDCDNAYNFCERAESSGKLSPTGVTNVPTAGVADNYQYYTFPTALTSQAGVWYNPKTGISDFGPYPTNQLGRDAFRTPGSWNLNFAVSKNTKITERFTLQLRLELYNAFNHANFIVNTGDTDVASFNAVDGYFNGNRNLQLGAKIIF
jgi:outer membrane receptor protein involved in Fe transport